VFAASSWAISTRSERSSSAESRRWHRLPSAAERDPGSADFGGRGSAVAAGDVERSKVIWRTFSRGFAEVTRLRSIGREARACGCTRRARQRRCRARRAACGTSAGIPPALDFDYFHPLERTPEFARLRERAPAGAAFTRSSRKSRPNAETRAPLSLRGSGMYPTPLSQVSGRQWRRVNGALSCAWCSNTPSTHRR